MDIEKALKLVTDYLSEYLAVFIATLQKPVARFQPFVPVLNLSAPSPGAPGTLANVYPGPLLNPKLFVFMLISIFIGTALNSLIPGRPATTDVTTTAAVTFVVWIAYSATIFILAAVFRGRASFLDTASVSLQLLATIYVVSNFITFLWGSLAHIPAIHDLHSIAGLGLIIDQPIYLYYIVQFALMAVYLPIALKAVYGFGLIRQLCAGVIPPLVWALLGIFAFAPIITPLVMLVTPTTEIAFETSIVMTPTLINHVFTETPFPTETMTATALPIPTVPELTGTATFPPSITPTSTLVPATITPTSIPPPFGQPFTYPCSIDSTEVSLSITNFHQGRSMRFTIGGGAWKTHDFDIPGDGQPHYISMPPGRYTFTASITGSGSAHGEPFNYQGGQCYSILFKF